MQHVPKITGNRDRRVRCQTSHQNKVSAYTCLELNCRKKNKNPLATTKALKDAWEAVRSMRTGGNCPMAMADCQCQWHMMGVEKRFKIAIIFLSFIPLLAFSSYLHTGKKTYEVNTSFWVPYYSWNAKILIFKLQGQYRTMLKPSLRDRAPRCNSICCASSRFRF